MKIGTKRFIFGTQSTWLVPPSGNHSPGADVKIWPKWKLWHFATNYVWPAAEGILIERFWIYTRWGAVVVDYYHPSPKWDWWVYKYPKDFIGPLPKASRYQG